MAGSTIKKNYCYIDEEWERITEKSTVCFECGHVFPDAEEALQASPDFCPLCLHDW